MVLESVPTAPIDLDCYLNSLIEHGTLSNRPRPVMLEVGAGWGAFAAVVKGKFPLTRYVMLDIPTSSIFQMGFLHRLSYMKDSFAWCEYHSTHCPPFSAAETLISSGSARNTSNCFQTTQWM